MTSSVPARVAIHVLMLALAACGVWADSGSRDIDLSIERVENGLSTAFVVEGREGFQKTHNIYDRMKHYRVPAVSIAVINGGRVEWAKGYGETEAGTGRMVDTETLFQVASIGKPVTSAGVLRLAERGMLDLDRDVNDYLRSWRLPENEFTRQTAVTLRELLSHTAGTTVHGFPGYALGSDLPTPVEILDGTPPCNTPPVRVDIPPCTQYRYSGGGYVIVQQVMEDALGRPFENTMRELVFEPADMHRTFYYLRLPASLEKNAAFAYLADGSPVEGGYHLYPEYGAGAGLWSTPSDLARFAIEIQNSYAGEPGSLLDEKTASAMLTPRLASYGLGFVLSQRSGDMVFSHNGGNRGYRNLFAAYARTGRGAVIMTNSDVGNLLADEIVRAIAAAYGWPDYRPVKKTPAALDADELAAVAGNYEIQGVGTVPFWIEGGDLFGPDPQVEDARVLFLPESPTRFFSPDKGWVIDFSVDGSGEVTAVSVSADGMTYRGARVR